METFENTNQTNAESVNLLDMPFEDLQCLSTGDGKDEFTMRIEVQSKSAERLLDKYGQPYVEIVVDYVTVPRGKRKVKKTRPYFIDGRLIWEKISDEPGIQYLVKLARTKDDSQYYDWSEIIRLDEDNQGQSLMKVLATEDEKESCEARADQQAPIEEQVPSTGIDNTSPASGA